MFRFGQIQRFVLACIAVPFAGVMLVSVLLLNIDQMLRLFNFVVNENGPISLVFLMLGNLLPEYVALSLPISFFLGILLAFRRLSLNSELEVITGNGLSLRHLLPPIMILAVVLSVADYYIEGVVKPQSLYRYQQLGFEAQHRLFTAHLHEGEFLPVTDDTVLRFGQLGKGGRSGKKVFFRACDADKAAGATPGHCAVITAKSGVFMPAKDHGHLTLRLKNGRQLVPLLADGAPVFVDFSHLDLDIQMPPMPTFRRRADIGEEATNAELRHALHGQTAQSMDKFFDYRANLHSRITNALGFFALPFLAIAFGVTDKRRNAYGGIILGIASLILYIEVMQFCTVWARKGAISPWLSMWPVLAVFTLSSMALFYLVAERPGVRILTPLRNISADIAEGIKSLFLLGRVQGVR